MVPAGSHIRNDRDHAKILSTATTSMRGTQHRLSSSEFPVWYDGELQDGFRFLAENEVADARP